MSLRDAIKDQHDAAEAHAFTTLLLSGSITPEKYAEYLYNHLVIFSTIEGRMHKLEAFNDMPDLFRADRIWADVKELAKDEPKVHDAALRCAKRISDVTDEQLLAYVYVYHFADMYGGQLIKDKVPGAGTRYVYEDRAGLIAALRPMLTDDLADEAKQAFAFTLELFDELAPVTA